MGRHLLFVFLLILISSQARAAPAGPLVKHLSSILKWTTRSSIKAPTLSDVKVVQFGDNYLVETVVEGNALGFVPYVIRVSQDGELYAVDEVNNNVVRITPPLSQYSRGRLVAGSFQGHKGHVDGKPSDARFNRPRGVTMDDNGNVYVADTANLAIRKIGEAGVTTIAGGKSNIAGYRDGPSEDAQFSNDFDIVYVQSTCSLLVIDRGNAALRQINLNHEDCKFQYNSFSPSDMFMVVGAILIGYATCILQLGFGHSLPRPKHEMETEADKLIKEDKQLNHHPHSIIETTKPEEEEQEAPWPSLGQLILDLSKLLFEATSNLILCLNPFKTRPRPKLNHKPKAGLTPLKDSLIMPEDQVAQKQKTPIPQAETRKSDPNSNVVDNHNHKHKLKSSSFRDPSLSSKHRSKRQEYSDLYGSNEVPSRSKSHKERTKHRQREKSGDGVLGMGIGGVDGKPNHMNFEDAKFEHFNSRSKFGESYRF